MIITDRFVFIHMPKTRDIFVSNVLFQPYQVRWSRLTHLLSALKMKLVNHNPLGTSIYNNMCEPTADRSPFSDS